MKAGCEGSAIGVGVRAVHSVVRCGVRVVTYGVMGSDLRGEKREAETEREKQRERDI
jgi:hypothetical protein